MRAHDAVVYEEEDGDVFFAGVPAGTHTSVQNMCEVSSVKGPYNLLDQYWY